MMQEEEDRAVEEGCESLDHKKGCINLPLIKEMSDLICNSTITGFTILIQIVNIMKINNVRVI